MSSHTLTFLGSGDAFGSGGRLQTCLHVAAGERRFLVDCGASSLTAMRRYGVEPNAIEAILLSHLHGDHFGGLPFFILDAQLVSRRTAPLHVAGPPGTAERLTAAMEVFFPGSSRVERRFAVEVTELTPGEPASVAGVGVTGFEVRHPSGAPPLALRVEAGGKTLAYTGDTEWCDALLDAARGADLLVAEGYYYEKPIPYHLTWQALAPRLPEIGAGRVVLTHMSADMLARAGTLEVACAEDGMTVAF